MSDPPATSRTTGDRRADPVPEGDTVFRTAARLNQALAGEPLTTTDLRWPELSTLDFRGVTTPEVVSRGKNILQRLANGVTIHSHLRMEGQWRVDATDRLTSRALANPQIRAVVGTAAWTAVGLRLGDLHVVETSDEARLVGHLGPDVLGADWDPGEAARRLHASRGDDRRRPARPAQPRRRRNPVRRRGALPRTREPVDPGRGPRRAGRGRARRPRAYPPRRGPATRDPDHHGQPAAGRDGVGPRPLGPAVPALRRDPAGGHGRRGAARAHDVLLSPLPGRAGAHRRRAAATAARQRQAQRARPSATGPDAAEPFLGVAREPRCPVPSRTAAALRSPRSDGDLGPRRRRGMRCGSRLRSSSSAPRSAHSP